MRELLLASKSPRRKHILRERGLGFRAFPIEVSEILDKNLNIPEKISDCARQKAEAAAASLKTLESLDYLILAADTVVVFSGHILGKPQNETEAQNFLTQLSGQWHQVITGFCLIDLKTQERYLGSETSQVKFKTLQSEEILSYIRSGEPMDKAGAYGIQGLGGQFVEEVRGDYDNIVGLPIDRILSVIKDKGWNLRWV